MGKLIIDYLHLWLKASITLGSTLSQVTSFSGFFSILNLILPKGGYLLFNFSDLGFLIALLFWVVSKFVACA